MNDTEQILVAPYGEDDASFQAAGGELGIRQLVRDFYRVMDTLPAARVIRDMHTSERAQTEDKLSRFLCGWLGGPKLYSEKYGSIRIPKAHEHLTIGVAERDAWLSCMKLALEQQLFSESFKSYLLHELFMPAERSRNCD